LKRKTYNSLALLLLLLWSSELCFAQPNTLYFMKGIPQTKDLNPARPGNSEGFYFSLPLLSKFEVEASTNNWSLNDLLHKGTGKADSTVMDLNNFITKIQDQNYIVESAALTIFEAGYRKEKNTYAISFSQRESGFASFDKNLIELAKSGNYKITGLTNYSGNLKYNAQHYRQIAFNYSHDLSKKITIGVAAKLLLGIGAEQSGNISLTTSPSLVGDSLNITAIGRINIALPPYMRSSATQTTATDNINSPGAFIRSALNGFVSNYSNPGFAFDFGFAWRMSPKVELSMSVVDLGVIVWTKHLYLLDGNNRFLYQGPVQTSPGQDLTPWYLSSVNLLNKKISKAMTLDLNHPGFSTRLPAKIYTGIDYQLTDAISLSGLSRMRIIDNTIRTSFTAGANTLIGDRWTISASYSVMESTLHSIGLAMGVKAGPAQFYAATDNVISPLNPAKTSAITLRFGVNLLFGTPTSQIKGKVKNAFCNSKN